MGGLGGDIVMPLAPTTVSFPRCAGVGNMGFQRAQFRVERYFYPHECAQWTVQFGLMDPVVTSYVNFDLAEGLQESNGWPNLEGRVACGLGPRCELPGRPKRTVEVGVSGVIGELRRTALAPPDMEDIWAYGVDGQVMLTEQVGFKGEFFTGKTIGMYNAAILQNFNANREGIRSSGGWGEVYVYWTPSLHSHFGYAIDNPRNSDLTEGRPSRNEVVFGNILCEATQSIEVGFEISHWKTAYMPPLPGNDSMIYHTRVRVKF
jgi:hypothetical protein